MATYLRSEGEIDPLIRNYLADMIDGSTSSTDHSLKAIKRPHLPRAKKVRQEVFEESVLSLQVATFMAESGAADQGGYEAGIEAAMTKFGLSKGVVKSYWRRWKRHAKRVTLGNRFFEALISGKAV